MTRRIAAGKPVAPVQKIEHETTAPSHIITTLDRLNSQKRQAAISLLETAEPSAATFVAKTGHKTLVALSGSTPIAALLYQPEPNTPRGISRLSLIASDGHSWQSKQFIKMHGHSAAEELLRHAVNDTHGEVICLSSPTGPGRQFLRRALVTKGLATLDEHGIYEAFLHLKAGARESLKPRLPLTQ